MDYTKLSEAMEELRKASQKCGTTFITATQVTNPCAEITLPVNYGAKPYVRRIFQRIDPPKTEEEMIALINRKDVIITVIVHSKRMRRGKLRRHQEEKTMRPNEYLKSIGWFYEKYALLFEDEENFLKFKSTMINVKNLCLLGAGV